MTPTGHVPAPRRAGRRWLLTPLVVVVVLAAALVALGVSVAAVAGVATGVRVASDQFASTKAGAPVRASVTESMEVLTGKMDGHPGWPRYTHTTWTVRKGELVTLRVTNYDDGTAPLSGAQVMYDRVEGTLGGTELVDGRAVPFVPNDDISHTFTVVGLGLNLPVPAAPAGRSVTVVARFVATRSGVFVWQCYAPCGSGRNSMGGAMSTLGWMEGTVRVLP